MKEEIKKKKTHNIGDNEELSPNKVNKRTMKDPEGNEVELDKKQIQRLEFLEDSQVKLISWKKKAIAENYFYINFPEESDDEESKEYYIKCQERLDHILYNDDIHHTNVSEDLQTFEKFCEEVPDWADNKNSFVFFRDHPNVKQMKREDVLHYSVQVKGLCYILASTVLQHYLVVMNTKKPSNVINLAELIRQNFDGLSLAKYIFEGSGGSSKHLLQMILSPKSIIMSTKLHLIDSDIQKYGPILVSEFQVYEDFLEKEKFIYHGDPNKEEESEGMHSMIVIGYRKDKNENLYYLLQNFWKKKQFVEVDGDYLLGCDCTFYFVHTPQYKIPEDFPSYNSIYTENCLDMQENYGDYERYN